MTATPADTLKERALTDAGHPTDVLKVDVRQIGKTTARVNVWVKAGVKSSVVQTGRIAYSAVYPTDSTN